MAGSSPTTANVVSTDTACEIISGEPAVKCTRIAPQVEETIIPMVSVCPHRKADDEQVCNKTEGTASLCASRPVLDGVLMSPTVTAQENIRPRVTIAPNPKRLKELIPAINFGAIVPGKVYRSSYPQPENYDFISHLKINTIL